MLEILYGTEVLTKVAFAYEASWYGGGLFGGKLSLNLCGWVCEELIVCVHEVVTGPTTFDP